MNFVVRAVAFIVGDLLVFMYNTAQLCQNAELSKLAITRVGVLLSLDLDHADVIKKNE